MNNALIVHNKHSLDLSIGGGGDMCKFLFSIYWVNQYIRGFNHIMYAFVEHLV